MENKWDLPERNNGMVYNNLQSTVRVTITIITSLPKDL